MTMTTPTARRSRRLCAPWQASALLTSLGPAHMGSRSGCSNDSSLERGAQRSSNRAQPCRATAQHGMQHRAGAAAGHGDAVRHSLQICGWNAHIIAACCAGNVKPQRVVLGGYGFGGDIVPRRLVVLSTCLLSRALNSDVTAHMGDAAAGAMATAFAPWCAINVRLRTIHITVALAHPSTISSTAFAIVCTRCKKRHGPLYALVCLLQTLIPC